MISVLIASLPYTDPVTGVTGGWARLCGGLGLLEDLGGHRLLDLAPAQSGDEADDDRALGLRVQRGADLVVEDAAVVRRSERVVAVDDADGLESAEALHDLFRWERPEPLEADEADLVALLAESPDRDLHRQGQ